jgi:RHS repeat-associated protein
LLYLAYTYQSSNQSNQLQTVLNSGSAFRSYAYDANGNATSDGANKTLAYNLLDLPQTITQGATTLATYTYDAAGRKLRNTGSDGSWDYISGIVYNNNAISFIQTEEGRAIPNGGNYHYEYNLTDLLGNVRISFDKNPTDNTVRTLQEDEYYAFGLRSLKQDNSSHNRYLYNGKEIQTDLTNQYDYGARFYDPVIARWATPDPLAEINRRWSPYNYVENNPIGFTDPDGMDIYDPNAHM